MSFIINPYVYSQPLCADTDGNAFLLAAGITDPTISSAICTLVTSLKTNNLWTKLTAIYPFVGGTATTHKFNLKDPQDTNAAFRLSFVGGWTHSSTGALPNGTNAYANTFNIPTLLNSTHISVYLRTNSTGLFNDIGHATSTTPNSIILARYLDRFYGHINQSADTFTTNTDSRGFFLASRTASNAIGLYKNNSLLLSSTVASTAIPTTTITISAFQQAANVFTRYSNRQVAFSSIGTGLTAAEASTYYNIIQTFQTSLSRQI
jgi:hypothetical protein